MAPSTSAKGRAEEACLLHEAVLERGKDSQTGALALVDKFHAPILQHLSITMYSLMLLHSQNISFWLLVLHLYRNISHGMLSAHYPQKV